MLRCPELTLDLARAALGALVLTSVAAAQGTTRTSVDSSGVQGNGASYLDPNALSADGQVVAFASYASNLVAGDTNGCDDVFVHDRATGVTTRVNVDSSGAQMNYSAYGIVGVAISADGRIVAFATDASNLVAGDTNGCYDAFVHDRVTGITERVSVDSAGAEGDSDSFFPRALSADGRFVTFHGYASNLVAGDTNDISDVFVHDRVTGTTERVSVDSSGAEADDYSNARAISADGRFVAFDSEATNLVAGDTNGLSDVFVHDRTTGTTQRVSVDSTGAEGDDESFDASISADGTLVAFSSYATNLVASDANGTADAFVHDRSTGVTERISVDAAGAEAVGSSELPVLSADGRYVAYHSSAANLVAGDTNGTRDVFVHDRSTGLVERVSVDTAGVEGNGNSSHPAISGDGAVVAFNSYATNLVAGDTNGAYDDFVHDGGADANWSNYGSGFAGTNGIPSFTAQADPVLGTTVSVDLANSSGGVTVAVIFIGFSETLVPTNKGGDLLVVPSLILAMTLQALGATLDGDLPDDDALLGLDVYVQALELDSGAAKGISFTAGLDLLLGR